MFVYVKQKNGKLARVTVPDWDIVNPLAIQQQDHQIQSSTTSKSQSGGGAGSGTGSGTGTGTDGDVIPDIILNAIARYLDT